VISDEIRARIHLVEAAALAAQVVEIWEYESDDHDRHISAIHCGLWSPAEALRHVAHARDVLDRHQPRWDDRPNDECDCDALFPCPEIVSLGKAWGVE
jgi:hypothetical protein